MTYSRLYVRNMMHSPSLQGLSFLMAHLKMRSNRHFLSLKPLQKLPDGCCAVERNECRSLVLCWLWFYYYKNFRAGMLIGMLIVIACWSHRHTMKQTHTHKLPVKLASLCSNKWLLGNRCVLDSHCMIPGQATIRKRYPWCSLTPFFLAGAQSSAW